MKLLFSFPARTFTDVAGFKHMRKCEAPVEVDSQTLVTCTPLDLGVGNRTTVSFLLRVPFSFPGKRLGVGIQAVDAEKYDYYSVTGKRVAVVTLGQGGGGTATTPKPAPTTTPPSPLRSRRPPRA